MESVQDTLLSMQDGESVRQYLKSEFQKELTSLPSGNAWKDKIQVEGI